MSGPDSGQFHRDLLREVEANREHIERLEGELARRDEEERRQREWMDAVGGVLSRLTGQPPPRSGQPDELAEQRRRRRERGNRRAGFIALPIAIGALLRRSLTRWALGSAAAATVALAAGGTILAVDSHPLHPRTPPVPAAHSSPYRTPGRSRPRPTPRRGQGKGTAARSTTDTTPPVSRSRAAVPHTTAPAAPSATQPATLPVVTVPSPQTHLPSPLPTGQPIPAILPSPIPSVTKVIGHLVCHLNLLGIRVCVQTG